MSLRSPVSAALIAAACTVCTVCTGCSGGGNFSQQPLPTHAPHQSLVLGHHGATNDPAIAGRKDATGQPTHLYRGPNGQLHYQDGSQVQFDSVKKQLQDLRSEENISPVR